jgi:hypothetical protein
MSANTNAALANAEPQSLAHLSDAELLTQTRSLVGRSNRLLADLLAHLGEVEARGIHRTRACSSLYTYCIYELRFSEDEAFRRVSAARLVRRFPALLDALASGELHLTGLLMLGPHLTAENLVEVMARAKHRTKRELARLVRVVDPLPPVPARIEPLGPAPAPVVPPEPSWEQFVGALNPVRDLENGERPRDWGLEDEEQANDEALEPQPAELTNERKGLESPETHASAPVHTERSGERPAPQRYKVQFTATDEYVQLVDEAKALLAHAVPRATLEDVQLRAMRTFVEALRKRKYGTRARPGEAAQAGDNRARTPGNDSPPTPTADSATNDSATHSNPRQRGEPAANKTATPDSRDPRRRGEPTANEATTSESRHPRRRGALTANETATSDSRDPRRRGEPTANEATTSESRDPRRRGEFAANEAATSESLDPRQRGAPAANEATTSESRDPRRRGRHIPAAIRRAVAARDGDSCTYVDAYGRRCGETRRLEFHHLVPFAVSPAHEVVNVTLRCTAHNALAAEDDFGRAFVQQKQSARHDRFNDHGP